MKQASLTERIVTIVERLQARFNVGSERLRAIENRLARLDGGDEANAAVAAAERQVDARRVAARSDGAVRSGRLSPADRHRARIAGLK